MGLFAKKPVETSSHAPLYTLSNQYTILLVGLGNIGKEYDGTRHNIGFSVLDNFVDTHDEFDNWVLKKDLKCHMATGTLGSTRVIAIKPTTFMNESGQAVKAVQQFYKVPNDKTIVVHDELDIDFGQIRTRLGGGSAGNNGIKSMISHCGDNFGRVRIGILNEHRGNQEASDFVLKQFSKEEQGHLSALLREADSILTEALYGTSLPTETRSFIV